MSKVWIEKECKHCGMSFIGGISQKFCNATCRIDFHNAQTNERRQLPKSVLKKALIYLANHDLLQKLFFRRNRQFSRQQLEDYGFQFFGFLDFTSSHFPTKHIWKYGKYQLVLDLHSEKYHIELSRPVYC